jgi:hypothetical protein
MATTGANADWSAVLPLHSGLEEPLELDDHSAILLERKHAASDNAGEQQHRGLHIRRTRLQ